MKHNLCIIFKNEFNHFLRSLERFKVTKNHFWRQCLWRIPYTVYVKITLNDFKCLKPLLVTNGHIRSHLVTKVMTHYESIVPHNLCCSKDYTFKRTIRSQNQSFDETTILLF